MFCLFGYSFHLVRLDFVIIQIMVITVEYISEEDNDERRSNLPESGRSHSLFRVCRCTTRTPEYITRVPY